jgi:hypothetical protein
MTQMQTEEVAVWERAPEHSPEVLPKCGKCGKTDSTLRVSAFMYALSAFVITLRRRGSSGIFCQSCRRKEAIKWSLLTGVLGWWGIPWGPIFSVQSIVRNLRGGAQDAELNAELLRRLARHLPSAVRRWKRHGRSRSPSNFETIQKSHSSSAKFTAT